MTSVTHNKNKYKKTLKGDQVTPFKQIGAKPPYSHWSNLNSKRLIESNGPSITLFKSPFTLICV
jgi:hypothetical protein